MRLRKEHLLYILIYSFYMIYLICTTKLIWLYVTGDRFMLSCCVAMYFSREKKMSRQPVIVVHGGAGAYSLVGLAGITRNKIMEGVVAAAKEGYSILKAGGTSVDAVQEAVVCMENNPIFNAGRGSYLTRDHTIEMDACIMDGASLRTGAVACIKNIANPIKVARVVMDKTEHTLFCGESAKTFAQQFGFDVVSTESLVTPKATARLKEDSDSKSESGHGCDGIKDSTTTKIGGDRHPDDHDTVGAVAVDCHGNVSVATSTGGITGQMSGRVGDSPLVGSGAYADNISGAVATTGAGEAFVKLCTAKHTAMLMEQGQSPQEATQMAIDLTTKRAQGLGGCISVNNMGQTGIYFNTGGMAWVTIKEDKITYGLYNGECDEMPYV